MQPIRPMVGNFPFSTPLWSLRDRRNGRSFEPHHTIMATSHVIRHFEVLGNPQILGFM